jgi:hypothetical protein
VNSVAKSGTKKRGGQYPRAASAQATPDAWLRLTTAPSIPVRHQSFGYQETAHGDLKLREPPSDLYTGSGKDTVGPNRYRPEETKEQSTRRHNFSNSRCERASIRKTTTPGPGSYELENDKVRGK